MERSENYGFYLPSRDANDVADINLVSENFRIIDSVLGYIESAQEEIIALQEGYIGGLTN